MIFLLACAAPDAETARIRWLAEALAADNAPWLSRDHAFLGEV